MRRSGIALIGLLVLALSLQCNRVAATPEDPIDRAAKELFVRYLRVDTSNPPGNETAGARVLAEALTAAGIEVKLLGEDPKRQSLYARLSSGNPRDALLLLHHIDVVPANASEWTTPPFSGEVSSGYVWGRGALDIKSLGVAELMAMLELKRKGVPLKRDVIYLAVADEEAGGVHGTKAILEQYPELFEGVGAVLNEGGSNEAIVDHVSIWGIEVAQKVPLWLRLRTRSMGGHGALPPDDGGAPGQLIALLSELQKMPRPYRLLPTAERQFRMIAQKKPGAKGEMLRDPRRYFEAPEFPHIIPASYRALMRDTMVVTHIDAGSNVNSIPSTAFAEIDLRLLPDRTAESALEEIREVVGKRGELEVILAGESSPETSTTHELYSVLARNMAQSDRGSIVVPMLSPGTSDSRYFRSRGIASFGISPFRVNYYDADTIHGIDEKIRTRSFLDGVRLMRKIVHSYCAS